MRSAKVSVSAERLGIRARLLCGFVVMALITGILGIYVVVGMEQLNAGQRLMYGDIFGGTHLLGTWVDNAWETRAALATYLLADDVDQRNDLRREFAAADERLSVLLDQMDHADTDREDIETLAGLARAWQAYTAWREQSIIAAVESGDRLAALAAYEADSAQTSADLDQAIDAFLENKRLIASTMGASA